MDSEQERLRLPEHKWIVNLKRYVQTIEDRMRNLDYCVDQEFEEELSERTMLINKYTDRITHCAHGLKCLAGQNNCINFHSKADLGIMKQTEENRFYHDKFHLLIIHLKPFFITEMASLIRGYCCSPIYTLSNDGLRCSFYMKPDRRNPMHVDEMGICVCALCDDPYDQLDPMYTSYYLTKDSDESNQDYYVFHESCGKDFLGLNTVTKSLSMRMHGWKLSLLKVWPENQWIYNLSQYIQKQKYKFNNCSWHDLCDLQRRRDLISIYVKRIRDRLTSR